MLKDLDPILTGALLGHLADMGHGDVIAIVDRNFPAHSTGRRVIEMPRANTTEVSRAILSVFPVDTFEEPAAFHMVPVDGPTHDPAFSDFQSLLNEAKEREVQVGGLERFDFYERTPVAYAVVATGDTRPYACF